MNILSYLFGSRPAHAQVALPDYKLLTSVSYFSKREIQRIYARYCVVCRPDGLISMKQFSKLPEVATYPLMLLAFQFESDDSYGLLNFSQIILLLSNFSAKGRDNEKIEFLNHIMKETNAKSDTIVTKEQCASYMGRLSHGSLPSFIFEEVLDKSLIDLPADGAAARSQASYDDLLYLVSEYDRRTRMSTVF